MSKQKIKTDCDLTRALDAAGIKWTEQYEPPMVPQYEYFEDADVAAHGDEPACLSQSWGGIAPLYLCVAVRDYNRALDLYGEVLDGGRNERANITSGRGGNRCAGVGTHTFELGTHAHKVRGLGRSQRPKH